MKPRCYCLLAFLIFLSQLSCNRSDDTASLKTDQFISVDEFEQKMMHALTASDSTEVKKFVLKSQYKTGDVLSELLNDYLKTTGYENKKQSLKALADARWLSELLEQNFDNEYYRNRIELFCNWTPEQKRKKLVADSLKEQARVEFEKKNFESSISLNSNALEIYRNLNDLETEARVLHGLGLGYGELQKYELAQEHLNKSLGINRQLGLTPGIMENLNGIGNVYQKQRNFEEALNYFRQSLDMAEQMGDLTAVGSRWANIGDTYHRMEDKENATSCLEKALKISLQTNDLSLEAMTRLNLGAVLGDLSQFDKAIDHYRKGLAAARQIGHRRYESFCLSNLGLAYRNVGKLDSAMITSKQAIKITHEINENWTEANTYREIGVIQYYIGLPDSAYWYWNKAMSMFETLKDTSNVGMLLGYIGIYYKNKGQPYKALDYYDKALALTQKTGNLREASNILSNKGNIYMDYLAEYANAQTFYKQALKIKKQLGEEHFGAVILGNLGVCYSKQGDYQKALEIYFKSLEIAKKTGHKSGEAKKYSEIADVYVNTGNYSNAAPYYRDALQIYRTMEEIQPQIGILMNQGLNFLNMNKSDSAFANYELALKLARQIEQKDLIGSSYFCIGKAYHENGEDQKSIEFYEKSAAIQQQVQSLRSRGEIATAKGDAYYKLENYEASEKNFKEGLQIAQKIGSPEGIWPAMYGLGKIMEQTDKLKVAEDYYARAIKTIESLRSKLTAQTLKQRFLDDKIEVYHAMINLLLKMGRNEEAFEYLERSKARCFLDILSTGQIDIAEGISEDTRLRKKLVERKLNEIQQQYISENSKQEQDPVTLAALDDSLEFYRHEHEKLLQQIEITHPRYARLTGLIAPLSVQEIQSKIIAEETSVIEYQIDNDHLIIWVIGNNLFAYEKVEIAKTEIEQKIANLLQPFKDVKEGRIGNFANIGFDIKLARQLYQEIFNPIEKYLNGIKNVIIVPDGVLHYLPFESLVTAYQQQKSSADIIFSKFSHVKYLVERYAFSYSSSASVLDPKFSRVDARNTVEGKLLAFGNPDFGKAKQAVQEYDQDHAPNYYTILTRSSRGWMFSQLPESEIEVKSIAGIMEPSLFYLGTDAKEEFLKEKAAKYSLIHIATHCIIDESQPLYSKIVFAQDDDPKEDGFLHPYEIFNIRLNAELVTLGACETGLGHLSRGEGLIGLTRAFMYAGAPSLIVSLWSVEESTSELMQLFYNNLKTGMTKSEALQQAKLTILKMEGQFQNGQRYSFAHPFLWAPFVLVGER